MMIGPKLWPLECSQGFSMIWPTDLVFWPDMNLYSNLTEILSRWSFWASLMMIGPKLWPLECSQGFSLSWPTDLVFDPTWPIFELNRDIVKMIILSKFDDDWTKTVASRVFTSQKVDARRTTHRRTTHRRTDDRQRPVTIAHHEHFVLRWANKKVLGWMVASWMDTTHITWYNQEHVNPSNRMVVGRPCWNNCSQSYLTASLSNHTSPGQAFTCNCLLEPVRGREWPQEMFHDPSQLKNKYWTRDLLITS